MKILSTTAIAAAMIAAVATSASAATTFSGNAVGDWQNLQGAAGSTNTISNHDGDAGPNTLASFSFGTANSPSDFTNLFTFNGVGSGGGAGFTTLAETPFVIGNFTYRNGVTTSGSFPNTGASIDLGILLAITSPVLPTTTYNYGFGIDITPNTTGDPVLDGDIVTIAGGTTSTTFTSGGTLYTLALTGFSTDGGHTFTTAFNSPEGSTANADLYGRITTQVLAVPEPASMALLGAGLVTLGAFCRRRG